MELLPGQVDPTDMVIALRLSIKQANDDLEQEKAKNTALEKNLAAKNDALRRASRNLKIAVIIATLGAISVIALHIPALWELIK